VTENRRTYTVDQLEALGLPWDNVLARFDEDEHRWYINWQIVFRDPADDTTWAITKTEDKTEIADLDWWYSYNNRDAIIARRVEPREVTVTQWFEVKNETAGSQS
jgi:hypothetical protein